MERNKPWRATWEGTPQGGPLSPLLANVYLHYALDVRFKKLGLKFTQLLRYCDDFIIISQKAWELEQARRHLSQWMQEASLQLKELKTRRADMRNGNHGRQSHVDFLGFQFDLRAYKDNPNRFWIARQPSEEVRKALKEELRKKVKAHLSVGRTRRLIKSVWMGWSNYFRYGKSNRVFYKELGSVRGIVQRYLRWKFYRGRHPVPWRRAWRIEKWIMRDITPLPVITDYLRHRQLTFAVN